MILTANLNLLSAIVIGAGAVLFIKQMGKHFREYHQTPTPVSSSQKQSSG